MIRLVNYHDQFLRAAIKIGAHLCNKAFWYKSKCNWIGRYIDNSEVAIEGQMALANHALGPEIYDGSSGIALFLSHLYAVTRNDTFRQTAEGAIKHAISHIEDIDDFFRLGFYDGIVGIGYASLKIADLLGDDSILTESASILDCIFSNKENEHSIDIISGNAGSIPALLEAYEVLHESRLYDMAVSLGDELILLANKKSIGWSWSSNLGNQEKPRHDLTGFSHGAAGFGFALLELYKKSEEKKYKDAAERAFSYENYWYSDEYENWPDLRETSLGTQGDKNHQSLVYARSWCHGAPGIALSRLHAYSILEEKEYLKDCFAALRTTVRSLAIDDSIYGSQSNYSLCHGLGGNCESLIYAESLFKDTSYKSIAYDVGIDGIKKYGNAIPNWPCGIRTGQTPGLMLGLAGIGYFYLRLYDSIKIPSILMVTASGRVF